MQFSLCMPFCRTADDIIDVNDDYKALNAFKAELRDFHNGITLDKPLWKALRKVFSSYAMDIKPFYQMLEGQEMNSDFKDFKTQEDLLNYCYLVAGTVGLMILPVLSSKNYERLKPAAVKLGIAMQITNILRDIGEDFNKGRIYIPEDIFQRFNYSRQELLEGRINKNFKSLWEYEAAETERLYKEFYSEISFFDRDSRAAVLLSTNLYKEILISIRKNRYDCLTVRNSVPDYRKLITVIKSNIILTFS
jgi:15-cis-phytoene synthase